VSDAGAEARFQAAVARHRQGDLEAAIDAYRAVLAVHPDHSAALVNLASALTRVGRSDEALACYERALRADARAPELWFNYANLLQRLDRRELAERAFREALARNPDLYPAHFNLANLLRDIGRLDEADRHYRETLRLRPEFVRAWTNLGNLWRQRGRWPEAISCHRKALALTPDDPDVHRNLGNALLDAGSAPEAAECYREADRLRPNQGDVLAALADALTAMGESQAARDAYRRALAADPACVAASLGLARSLLADQDMAGAQAVLTEALQRHPTEPRLLRLFGALHYRARRPAEAAEAYRQALEAEPRHTDTHNALGVVLADLGQTDQAIDHWRQALALDPGHAAAHLNLGTLLRHRKDYDGSFRHLREAERLDPQNAMAKVSLAFGLIEVGRAAEARPLIDAALGLDPRCRDAHMAAGFQYTSQALIPQALEAFAEARRIDAQHSVAITNALFASLYSDRHDALAVTRLHRELAGELERISGAPFPVRSPRTAGRPLRIGYLSPDLLAHPVGYFLEPVLGHHDPARVEVFCYSLRCSEDETATRLRGLTSHWRDCQGWDDDRLGLQVQQDEIDILVDLAGHTAHNRARLLARKPAPIQALYLGYPCSSGLAAMDYLIADPWVAPLGQEHLFTERVARLAHCFLCFRPQPGTPGVAAPPFTRNGYITFGAYNNLPKLSPTILDLWAQVLAAVPDSRLALKTQYFTDPGSCADFRERFAARGIDPERLDLLPPTVPLTAFLAEYGRLDIALDPTPYNGGTTTCDALWMGVPVVSLAGEHFFSRMGASVLNTVGLPELVATTPEEYVHIAAALAGDPDRMSTLRSGMRERLGTSPLCDETGFTRDLERIYRQMVSGG